MLDTHSFSRALVFVLITTAWSCGGAGAPAGDSQQTGANGRMSPVLPSAAAAMPGATPGAPVIPVANATNGPNEAPPVPSLEQAPPVTSISGGPAPDPNAGLGEGTPPVTTPPVPATCSSASTLAAGSQAFTIDFDGDQRTYIVHVPTNLDASTAVPLVVDMHGLTSTAGAQAGLSGWRAKADEEGFIVAHPQGLGNSWNGGELCCGSSQSGGVDDEGFIRAMVAKIEEDACIDPRRVYATGLSNGGAMSHLLACNAADLFAASAPVSMGNGARPCEPSRPISVIMTRGTQDTLVAFDGGLFPSAQADFEQWAELNNCQGEPEAVDELCEAFTNCDAGVEVKLCALAAGHVLYRNSQNFSVPDTVWATFERQTLP